MTLDSLETAIFGYKKESVYRFITETEQKFSAKLIEQEESAQRMETQLQARIRQLEEENDALCARLERQQHAQMRCSAMLSDAAQMADFLQEECATREQSIRRMLEEEHEVRQQLLEQYLRKLRSVCYMQDGPEPETMAVSEKPAASAADAEVPSVRPVAADLQEAAAGQNVATDEPKTSSGTETAPAAADSAVLSAKREAPTAELQSAAADSTRTDDTVPVGAVRSVRVGGTSEAQMVDPERNMSLFQRRAYPAD